MAITFWKLGHATATTARVFFRSDTAGSVILTCNGSTFSGAAGLVAATDGTGVIEVAGLSANGSYDFTLTDATGDTVSGTLRTMPTLRARVAFISCDERVRALTDLAQNIIASGANAVVHQGDYLYTNAGVASLNGEAATNVTTGTNLAGYFAHWRQCSRKVDKRLLETTLPHYFMADDHEFGGDNWDHSVTQAQQAPNVASGDTTSATASGTQTEAAWWTANQAILAYHAGNPPNVDVASVGDKPAIVSAAASQYPVRYYRNTIGNVEFFHIDCFSYRDHLTKTDNGSKTMLGATQKQWLKDRLAASAATFKVICSGKTTYAAVTAGTADDWLKYTAERDELIAYIAASVPSKGVVWVCGDAHGAFVTYLPATGHIAMCANPAGVAHIAQTAGYTAGTIWKQHGSAAPSAAVLAAMPAVFGLVESSATELTLRLIDQYGAILWTGAVTAGTSVLRTPV